MCNNKFVTQLSLYTATLLILSSCSRTAYVPSIQNVPMLTEKHDLNATLSLNYFKGAYAISDHIGLVLNAETDGLFKNLTEEDSSKKHVVEFGAGYFTPLNQELSLGIYAGAGLGKISFEQNTFNNMGRFSARKTNYYLQPHISYKTKFIEFAFSTRFTKLDYYNLDDTEYNLDIDEETEETAFDLRLIEDPIYNFIEPAFTLRTGSENIKLSLQIQHSYLLGNNPLTRKDRRFTLGLNFNFNTTKPNQLNRDFGGSGYYKEEPTFTK